jgi:hypothetical protein
MAITLCMNGSTQEATLRRRSRARRRTPTSPQMSAAAHRCRRKFGLDT